jgi:hypothetical protein
MRKIITLSLTLICLLSNGQTTSNLNGTRLFLKLPKDFFTDNRVPCFSSNLDSSYIRVSEMSIPIQFDKWVKTQIKALILPGSDTTESKSTLYNGYHSIQFHISFSNSKREAYALIFGHDSLQVMALAEYPKNRREEIKSVILNGIYDKTYKLDPYLALGFKPSISFPNIKIASLSAISIRYQVLNEMNETIGYLNLSRSPKAIFENADSESIINLLIEQYYPKAKKLNDLIVPIDNYNAVTRILKTDHPDYLEMDIVGFLTLPDFDLMILGVATSPITFKEMIDIIKSVKILNK